MHVAKQDVKFVLDSRPADFGHTLKRRLHHHQRRFYPFVTSPIYSLTCGNTLPALPMSKQMLPLEHLMWKLIMSSFFSFYLEAETTFISLGHFSSCFFEREKRKSIFAKSSHLLSFFFNVQPPPSEPLRR